jgi:AP-1-like factor
VPISSLNPFSQLEDKVAELEAKSSSAETENQQLKELLKRLQDENVSLRNTSFTFSVPRNGDPTDGSFPSFASSPTSVFTPASHLPSPSSSGAPQSATSQPSSSLDTPSAFPGDIDFGTLGPSPMNLLDDSDATMSYDFGYGQFIPSKTPYKTIASAPMFMSFADPTASESAPASKSTAPSPGSNAGSPFDLTFGQWSGQTMPREGNTHTGALDELFGGHIFGTQSPVHFGVLMNSPATSPLSPATSPVIHQSIHPSNGSSSTTSPTFENSSASSPGASSHSGIDCPKTRAEMEQRVQSEGSSIFAPPPPPPPPPAALEEPQTQQIFTAPAGADGPMIMCKGATFPPTEKSDNNIEVLTAWRSITSHPHFKASVSSSSLLVQPMVSDVKLKNVDINELCSEFTDKARCDGTKVVLDPQGVNSILEKLTSRLKASP